MSQPTSRDDKAVGQPAEDRDPPVRLLVILLVGAVSIDVIWVSKQQGLLNFGDRSAIGQRLEKVVIAPLDGEGERLTEVDLEGSVTLINFWGTWCRPCMIEFPHLVEMNERLKSNPGFRFLPVACGPSVGQEGGGALQMNTEEYLRAEKYTLPVYSDPGGVTRRSMLDHIGGQEFPFPTTVLLDREGVIRGLWTGYTEGAEAEMEEQIKQLLQ